jgi:non-ribosomal peptide synthetase component F
MLVVAAVQTSERQSERVVDRRSNRLGRALLSLGVQPGDHIAVVCCDRHLADRLVGVTGAQKAGAVGVALVPDGPEEWIARQLRQLGPRLILACSEGVAAWRRTGVPCVVVGDEPGVTWWKLLEARQSAEPMEAQRLPADVVELVS